ncbi:MAG TPA: hypothetical protein VNI01_09055, partial [Elusimicrobiota bacterium]|nr:hypothetical protein [Elusimicrobiota bacterium]
DAPAPDPLAPSVAAELALPNPALAAPETPAPKGDVAPPPPGEGAGSDGAKTHEQGSAPRVPGMQRELDGFGKTTESLNRALQSGGSDALQAQAAAQFQGAPPSDAILTNLPAGWLAPDAVPSAARAALEHFRARSPFPVGLLIVDAHGLPTKISLRVPREELLRDPEAVARAEDSIRESLERETGFRVREIYSKTANPGVPFDTFNFVLDWTLSRGALESVLSAEPFSPDALIERLKRDPFLREQFASDVGLWETFTLERHTRMMMGQFERYFPRASFAAPVSRGLFRLMLALHDIGKAQAVRAGDKRRQHEFTRAIMRDYLGRMGYGPREIDALVGIVDGDPIGPYLNPASPNPRTDVTPPTLAETIAKIDAMAERAGLPPKGFFRLLLTFYMSDAGSYTNDAGGSYTNDGTQRLYSLDGLFRFDRAAGAVRFSERAEERMRPLLARYGAEP